MPHFRVGITPDFYVDAKGRFERVLEQTLSGIARLEFAPMPPQPGKLAAPEALDQFDAIFALGLKFTRESLRGLQRLALIARWGVGYDMIDVEAITEAGVLLAITPKAVRGPVAEAILTLMFALSKNLLEQDRITRQGRWRGDLSRLGRTLDGKTLGSLGCGNIARELFRRAASLGFGRFIAHDPYVEAEAVRGLGVETVSMEELFRASDYLAVNTLLNAATRGLVGERQFRMMKPGAFFINTARGPIVEQQALVKALQERWIAGAGIDVFAKEPPDPDDPLLKLDNVILAPHGLAWAEELARDNTLEACQNILTVARGEVPEAIVNPAVLEHPAFQRKLARFKAAPAG
ncbi:MAG: NAD(P)-dependent oxidoreductase [Acidobacteriota bacterium]